MNGKNHTHPCLPLPTGRRQAGFTLIEMLIVVAIIGLLSSVVLVGLGDVRKDARDTRRVSDLRQIQNALEIYYMRTQSYPEDLYTEIPSAPYDPLVELETGTLLPYAYEKIDQNTYRIGACLEGDRPKGISHVTEDIYPAIENYGYCNCSDEGNLVYCVQN